MAENLFPRVTPETLPSMEQALSEGINLLQDAGLEMMNLNLAGEKREQAEVWFGLAGFLLELRDRD